MFWLYLLAVSMHADKELPQILRPVIKGFQQLLVDLVNREEEETDLLDKHLIQIVISSISLLSLRLPPDNPYTIKVYLFLNYLTE